MDQLATLHPDHGKFTPKELALLDYVKVLTLTPARTRDADVEKLRAVGWTDDEIFEASFITALFAFFNRMADAYGLDFPPNGWLPEERRGPASQASAGKEAGPKGN